jgi:imidazolonepropionase-like amidohydrolase
MKRAFVLISMSALALACRDGGRAAAPSRSAEPVEADASSRSAEPVEPKPEPAVAFMRATVIPGDGSEPIENGVVLLAEDRIVGVGTPAQVPIKKGTKIITLEGKWIVPGLVDSHIHYFQSGGVYTRPDIVDLRGTRSYESEVERIQGSLDATFRQWLASGVTAVVDMGGPFWNFDVRERANSTVMAPRTAVAGPLVSTISRPKLDVGDPPIIQAQTPEQARELVREQIARKPDLVKIWFIVTEERGLDQTIEITRAAIDEASKAGVRVAVHATELETARAAVEAGASVLVHSVHDKKVDQSFVDLVKDRGVIYIPTLAVLEGYAEVLGQDVRTTELEKRFGDPDAMATWAEFAAAAGIEDLEKAQQRKQRYLERAPVMNENLRILHEAGIPIAAGTDAGNIGTLHGPTFHRELQLMAEAGMSPMAVLVSATREAARVFATEPEFGTIQGGKIADLLVLDADPLVDVANLQKIHLVIKGGVMLEPDAILEPNPAWVVQKQVEAYNARDIDAFLSFYSSDAVIERHPTGEVVARGRDAMRTTYEKLFESSPGLDCRIVERIVSGKMVVDHELVTGIGKRPYTRAVAVYTVENGLITHVLFLPRPD